MQAPVGLGGTLQARLTVTSSEAPEFTDVDAGVIVTVGVSTWKNLTMTDVVLLAAV